MANYSLDQLMAEKKRRLLSSKPKMGWSKEELLAEKERRKSFAKPIEEPKEEIEESYISTIPRTLARGARNTIAGIADLGDLLATPARAAINVATKPFGYEVPTLAEETTKAIDVGTKGYTAPQNQREKTEEAVGRAVSGMLPGVGAGMALKGLKYVPETIKSTGKFLQGANELSKGNIAASGATSGLIQEHLNRNPQDTIGAVGKGLTIPASQAALSLLTKKGRMGATARTGELLNVNPEAVETFQRAGVNPTLADVSNSKIAKMVSNTLEHVPFAGSPIVKAKEAQKLQILEGLGQGELGTNLSRTEASALTKKGTKGFQKQNEQGFSKVFDKLEQDIQRLPDDNVGIENVNKFFDPILKKIKKPSQEKRFKESELGKMYVDLYESARESGGKLPYDEAKQILDKVNDKITTHGLIGKVSQGKLKQFAGRMAKDIEESLDPKMKELGGDSYSNWKQAKKHYAEYAETSIPKLNEIYKKDKKGATEAFVDLVTNQKRGAEKAKLVLKGLDQKDQIDLTDAIHRQLGKTSDGSFSPLKWVRGYKDLDPEAQKVLLSPLNKTTQKKFGDIANTIDLLKGTLAEANTSKTAHYNGLKDTILGLGAVVGGNVIGPAKLGMSLALGRTISSKMLTNPKFINWMYRGMKAKNVANFEKILNDVPHVGAGRKNLIRQVQTFQHDLNMVKREEKGSEKEKKVLHMTPRKGKPALVEYKAVESE